MKPNRKNKILLLCFVVSLYLCYCLAVSKTLFYRNQYVKHSNMNKAFSANPKILAQLKYKENEIDKWLAENNTSTSSFQNELLKQLNLYSGLYKLKITDFQVPHAYPEKGYTMLSYSFTLEGGFNNVLLLINKLENKQTLGQVKHIHCEKKTNFKTNQEYLTTTVIIQKPSK